MEYKDYYQILGVTRNADEKAIKRAYRELVKKLHPDTNAKDKTLEAKMRDVNEAYSVLSNPEKRVKYDQLGANWEELSRQTETSSGFQSTADYDLGSSPFSDFFRAFFSDQGFDTPGYTTTTRRTRKRKGEDLQGSVQISLEEAFHGSMREIQVDFGGNKKSLSVKIPPGIENGTRIRLRGQGYPGSSGGEPGNLYLEVQISSLHMDLIDETLNPASHPVALPRSTRRDIFGHWQSFHLHLMTHSPLRWIEQCWRLTECILVHTQIDDDLMQVIVRCRQLKRKVGVVWIKGRKLRTCCRCFPTSISSQSWASRSRAGAGKLCWRRRSPPPTSWSR